MARRIGQCANRAKAPEILICVTCPPDLPHATASRFARVAIRATGLAPLRVSEADVAWPMQTQGARLEVPLLRARPTRRELVRRARAWLEELDTGQIASRAAIARREGISRARVTQVLGLLRSARVNEPNVADC